MADVIKSFILYLLPISCIIGFLEASFHEVKRIEKRGSTAISTSTKSLAERTPQE